MRCSKPLCTLFVLLVLGLPCPAQTASARLAEIMKREWAALMDENPGLAIYLGSHPSRLWGDSSAPAREASDARYRKTLRELSEIDDATLSPSERINKRLFAQQLGWQVQEHRLGLDLFNMNQRDGLHTTATPCPRPSS